MSKGQVTSKVSCVVYELEARDKPILEKFYFIR